MVNIIVTQFVAPLQSWGDSSVFNKRGTKGFPTKSGVIGLLASAMGIDRNDIDSLNLSRLKEVDIAVRVDNPGRLISDFQIIRHSNGKNKLSQRDFIADAKFLVLITHPDELILSKISETLKKPQNLLFFGRKSCVPSKPIFIDQTQQYNSVQDALKNIDFIGTRKDIGSLPEIFVKTIVTDVNGDLELRDVPITFEIAHRKYITRRVKVSNIAIKNKNYVKKETFDPMEVIDVSN